MTRIESRPSRASLWEYVFFVDIEGHRIKGGAQMWMEEHGEERVNNKRTLQLLNTGATTVASGCPFCMTMLTDGLKAQEKEEEVSQRDIAEILADAIEHTLKD